VQITDEPLPGGRTETDSARNPEYHPRTSGLLSSEEVTTMNPQRVPQQPVPQQPVPQQLSRQLDGTRTGRRYQRLLNAHAHQLDFLVTVHPDVRDHVDTALDQLCTACSKGTFDTEAVSAASRVLDDLARYGDIAMQRTVGQLREELTWAANRPFDQVLADH
jgi:hypothetical protein